MCLSPFLNSIETDPGTLRHSSVSRPALGRNESSYKLASCCH